MGKEDLRVAERFVTASLETKHPFRQDQWDPGYYENTFSLFDEAVAQALTHAVSPSSIALDIEQTIAILANTQEVMNH